MQAVIQIRIHSQLHGFRHTAYGFFHILFALVDAVCQSFHKVRHPVLVVRQRSFVRDGEVQEIPNGIGNIGDAVRQPTDGTLNAVNDALNDVPSPVPSIGSQSPDISHSGIESILNGGLDTTDLIRNCRTNVVPDAGHRRRNALHHVGNGALDAVPDVRYHRLDGVQNIGNRRRNLIPDRRYHKKNSIHHTGNRAGDAVPDGRNHIPDRRQNRRNETRYRIPNRSHHILNRCQNRGNCSRDGIPDGFKCRSDTF